MSEQPDVRVKVEVRFRADHSQPGYLPHGRWLFQYVIRIENHGSESWQVMGREWNITDGRGQVTQVAGEGVVGQTPVIAPGGVYVYDSFVTMEATPGRMGGAYILRDAWGNAGRATIPEFALELPSEAVRPGGNQPSGNQSDEDGTGRVLN